MLEHFNCIVEIVNKTKNPLTLLEPAKNKHGDYAPAPPKSVAAGAIAKFRLKHTNWSPYGTAGSCQYQAIGPNGSSTLQFSYSCPSGTGENSADAIIINGAESGISLVMIPNPLPQDGHPVEVQFTVQ